MAKSGKRIQVLPLHFALVHKLCCLQMLVFANRAPIFVATISISYHFLGTLIEFDLSPRFCTQPLNGLCWRKKIFDHKPRIRGLMKLKRHEKLISWFCTWNTRRSQLRPQTNWVSFEKPFFPSKASRSCSLGRSFVITARFSHVYHPMYKQGL